MGKKEKMEKISPGTIFKASDDDYFINESRDGKVHVETYVGEKFVFNTITEAFNKVAELQERTEEGLRKVKFRSLNGTVQYFDLAKAKKDVKEYQKIMALDKARAKITKKKPVQRKQGFVIEEYSLGEKWHPSATDDRGYTPVFATEAEAEKQIKDWINEWAEAGMEYGEDEFRVVEYDPKIHDPKPGSNETKKTKKKRVGFEITKFFFINAKKLKDDKYDTLDTEKFSADSQGIKNAVEYLRGWGVFKFDRGYFVTTLDDYDREHYPNSLTGFEVKGASESIMKRLKDGIAREQVKSNAARVLRKGDRVKINPEMFKKSPSTKKEAEWIEYLKKYKNTEGVVQKVFSDHVTVFFMQTPKHPSNVIGFGLSDVMLIKGNEAMTAVEQIRAGMGDYAIVEKEKGKYEVISPTIPTVMTFKTLAEALIYTRKAQTIDRKFGNIYVEMADGTIKTFEPYTAKMNYAPSERWDIQTFYRESVAPVKERQDKFFKFQSRVKAAKKWKMKANTLWIKVMVPLELGVFNQDVRMAAKEYEDYIEQLEAGKIG